MRNQGRELAAQKAADFLRERFGLPLDEENLRPPIGLILGTGWGDTLELKDIQRVPFADIPGFPPLEMIEGHAREVVCGTIDGVRTIALRGRVHLNEAPADPNLYKAVRQQVEMLLQLGVKRLILTCAVGGLGKVYVGDVVLIDGFCTLFAPNMPLYAGEFVTPESIIDQKTIEEILQTKADDKTFRKGGHVMVPGPFFEGVKYDKGFLASTGCDVVGMSVLPEACVAALYEGVRVLPIAFVTDGVEVCTHEENMRKAKEASGKLGDFLRTVIAFYSR